MKINELNKQQLRELFYEDGVENFIGVRKTISHKTRWSIVYDYIVLDTETGQFFEAFISVGATENQDMRAFDSDDYEWTEVFETKQIVTVFEEKRQEFPNVMTRTEMFEILEQIAKDLNSQRKHVDEDTYADGYVDYAGGYNAAIDDIQQYLNSGAQMIRTD